MKRLSLVGRSSAVMCYAGFMPSRLYYACSSPGGGNAEYISTIYTLKILFDMCDTYNLENYPTALTAENGVILDREGRDDFSENQLLDGQINAQTLLGGLQYALGNSFAVSLEHIKYTIEYKISAIPENVVAIIANIKLNRVMDHWVALIKVNGVWFQADSLNKHSTTVIVYNTDTDMKNYLSRNGSTAQIYISKVVDLKDDIIDLSQMAIEANKPTSVQHVELSGETHFKKEVESGKSVFVKFFAPW
jgi:hypothetical protein